MLLTTLLFSSLCFSLGSELALFDADTAKQRTALLQADKILQSLVSPGPTVVTLLGNLLVVSTKKDFNLNKARPVGGFKYVKVPDSFRATLVQITNEGWSAFNVAQKNMDKIQLFMQTVPVSIDTSMRIISKGSDRILKLLLPKSLKQISSVGDQCVQLALETEDAFRSVMELTGEVLTATVAAEGLQDQDLVDVKAVLNSTRQEARQLEDYGKKLKERLDKLNKMADDYRLAYEKAMDDIPHGWKAFLQGIVGTIVDGVKSIVGRGSKSGGGDITVSKNEAQGLPDTDQFILITAVKVLLNEAQVTKTKLTHIFATMKLSGEDDPIKAFKTIRPIIEDNLHKVKTVKEETTLKIQTVDLLKKGITLAQETSDAFKGGIVPKDAALQKSLLDQADKILRITKRIIEEQTMNDPTAIDDQDYMPSGDGDGAQFRAELARRQMEEAQKRADKVFAEYLKYQESMGHLMADMAKLDFERIDFKQILDLMRRGIDLLGQIRKQWSQLIGFFAQISARADVTLKQTLTPFIEEAEEIISMTGAGLSPDDRKLFQSLLSEQARDINGVAYYLYTVSSAYVEVSQKYMIDKLAGIAKMLQANTDQERKVMIRQLGLESEKANDAIKAYLQQRRDDYKTKISQEIDDLKNKARN